MGKTPGPIGMTIISAVVATLTASTVNWVDDRRDSDRDDRVQRLAASKTLADSVARAVDARVDRLSSLHPMVWGRQGLPLAGLHYELQVGQPLWGRSISGERLRLCNLFGPEITMKYDSLRLELREELAFRTRAVEQVRESDSCTTDSTTPNAAARYRELSDAVVFAAESERIPEDFDPLCEQLFLQRP